MSQYILATGGYEPSVRIFNAQDQSLIRTLVFPDSMVLRLAFSGGDRPQQPGERLLLAVAGSPRVAVYDVTDNSASPTPFYVFTKHTAAVTAVGFDPRGTFAFSGSEDGTLHTWWIPGDGVDAYVPVCFKNTADREAGLVPINDVVYCAHEKVFITADHEGRLRVWDLVKKTMRKSVLPHRSRRHLQCLELASDSSLLVTANLNGLVFVYNVAALVAEEKTPVVPLSVFRAGDSYITKVRLNASMTTLVCLVKPAVVKVYRLTDVLALGQPGSGNAANGDATSEATTNSNYDPERLTSAKEFAGHPGTIWDAAYVGSERYMFTCSANTQVMLWDMEDIANSNDYSGHSKPVVCIAVKERMPGCPILVGSDHALQAPAAPPQAPLHQIHHPQSN